MNPVDIVLFCAIGLAVVIFVYLLTVKVKVPTASDVVVPNRYYVNYMGWGRRSTILTKGKPTDPEKHGILKTVRFYRAAFVRESININIANRMADTLKMLETEGVAATEAYLKKEIQRAKVRSRIARRTRQR